jgi:hypothetical protein
MVRSWWRNVFGRAFHGRGQVGGRREAPRSRRRRLEAEVLEERWVLSLTTLASFTAPDPLNPNACVIRDSNGNLFGASVNGGSFGDGTVF